jgi:hypothetical protein
VTLPLRVEADIARGQLIEDYPTHGSAYEDALTKPRSWNGRLGDVIVRVSVTEPGDLVRPAVARSAREWHHSLPSALL